MFGIQIWKMTAVIGQEMCFVLCLCCKIECYPPQVNNHECPQWKRAMGMKTLGADLSD